MAAVTAALVKQLRDQTGAGMMDCKAALTETAGDFEAAVDWLADGVSARVRAPPRPNERRQNTSTPPTAASP